MREQSLPEHNFPGQSCPDPATARAERGRSLPVVYAPRILKSMREICEAFGVGPKTVKSWVKQKAPIAVEGDGKNTRYAAELMRVQVWRENLSIPPAMVPR